MRREQMAATKRVMVGWFSIAARVRWPIAIRRRAKARAAPAW